MQLNVTVVSVEQNVDIAKKDGGSYKGTRLSYRDAGGKLQEQAFHSNVLKYNPKLTEVLGKLNAGDNIVIDKIKDGDFWKVTSIIKSGDATPSPASGGNKASPVASPKNTYETPEERAQKQVYIVRQSSITAALTFLGSKAKDVNTVVDVAKQFEAYVFGNNNTAGFAADSFPGDEDDVVQ